ncbi:zincin, partial [Laetiporus sulphureus 93-53]
LEERLKGLKKGAVGDRAEFCTTQVEEAMGFATGRYFVNETFAGDSKEKGTRIINGQWMDEKSAHAAAEKADALRVKVGYPLSPNTEDPRSIAVYYDRVTVHEGRFFDSIITTRANDEYWKWQKLGKQRDPETWEMFASTVNAYYNPPANEIVFPAGILQPPFFSQAWPGYMSYGSFGMVAAHELTPIGDAKYTIDDGKGGKIHINGNLTSGENIGDTGIIQAYRAWKVQYDFGLEKGTEQLLPGLNFTRRADTRPGIEKGRLMEIRHIQGATGLGAEYQNRICYPHSSNQYRVDGTVYNVPEFAEAFKCSASAKLNPPQEKRCLFCVNFAARGLRSSAGRMREICDDFTFRLPACLLHASCDTRNWRAIGTPSPLAMHRAQHRLCVRWSVRAVSTGANVNGSYRELYLRTRISRQALPPHVPQYRKAGHGRDLHHQRPLRGLDQLSGTSSKPDRWAQQKSRQPPRETSTFPISRFQRSPPPHREEAPRRDWAPHKDGGARKDAAPYRDNGRRHLRKDRIVAELEAPQEEEEGEDEELTERDETIRASGSIEAVEESASDVMADELAFRSRGRDPKQLRQDHKERGSIVARLRAENDLTIPNKHRGSYKVTSMQATKAKEKKAKAAKDLKPANVDVFIPSVVSVGTLAKLLNITFDNLLRTMIKVKVGIGAEASHDHILTSEYASLLALEFGRNPVVNDEAASILRM